MAAAAASSSSSGTSQASFLLPNPGPERGKALRMHVSDDGEFMAYGSGPNVVVRSTKDLTSGFVYEEHSSDVKCAAFSPDGAFIASGDAKGEVRVWSVHDAAHTLRKQLMGLPGGVEDIAWDSSGTVLGLAGQGKDKHRVLTVDSGTDMGTMQTMAKTCLAAAASRGADTPLFAFGGEDRPVCLYAGKPVKQVGALTEHTAFVNALAFSPDGSKLVTTGSDKTIVVREAATGAVLSSTKAAHKGSIYNVCFSQDGSHFATSSADKTIIVWKLQEDGSIEKASQVVAGKSIPDMQNGLVWAAGDRLVSCSLAGELQVSTPASTEPDQRWQGPAGETTSLAFDGSVFVTGDRGGAVCVWRKSEAGEEGFVAHRVAGDGHGKTVGCVATLEGRFASGGFDDKLRFGDVASASFAATATVGAQPKAVALVPGMPNLCLVATSRFVKSFDTGSGAELACMDAAWEGKALAVAPDGKTAYVGGGDGLVRAVSIGAAGELTEVGVSTSALRAAVASLSVSPDGAHVAVGDAGKEVCVLAAAAGGGGGLEFVVKGKWTAHTSRVASLAWSPDGSTLASTGVDRHVFLWRVSESHPVVRLNLAAARPAHSVVWEADGSALWLSSAGGVTKRIPVSM